MLKQSIPTRSRSCHCCGELFLPGATYFTYLQEEIRNDLCSHCLKPKEGAIFWEGLIPAKQEEHRDQAALELFYTIYEEEKKSALFILALYLERKKQLIRRPSKSRQLLFEEPQKGALFFIEPTPLTPEGQVEVKQELARLFEALEP